MLLKHRLTILKHIMRRKDLSAAAKQLAWFLLCERMNAETSQCLARNDQTLATDVGISVAAVERSKQQLRKADLLDWTIDHSRKIAGFRATYYRFNKKVLIQPSEMRESLPQKRGTPSILRDQHSLNSEGPKNNDPDAERRIIQRAADTVKLLKAFGANQAAAELTRRRQ